jgi:hypothetical protein
MDPFKKKQIEAKLRLMIRAADQPEPPQPALVNPMRGSVRVIRRRPGRPVESIPSSVA